MTAPDAGMASTTAALPGSRNDQHFQAIEPTGRVSGGAGSDHDEAAFDLVVLEALFCKTGTRLLEAPSAELRARLESLFERGLIMIWRNDPEWRVSATGRGIAALSAR